MKIGIVADDLTGAADSAAPFAALGWHATVQWLPDRRRPTPGAAQIPPPCDPPESSVHIPSSGAARAISTGVRDLPETDADEVRRRVGDALRALGAGALDVVYKKIDSTLRGHLRLELDAVRAALPGRLAIVCPAFPANGRTVRDGVLHVHGEPRGSVREAFEMVGDPHATEMSLPEIRGGPERVAKQLRALHAAGAHALFCDAETDADLAAIAAALLQMPDLVLPVGSAGLAAAIAGAAESHAPRDAGRQTDPTDGTEATRGGMPIAPTLRAALRELAERPVLVVVGSRHAASRGQAERLAAWAGVAPITMVACDRPEELVASLGQEGQDWHELGTLPGVAAESLGRDEQDLQDGEDGIAGGTEGSGRRGAEEASGVAAVKVCADAAGAIARRFAAGNRIVLVVTPDEDHAGFAGPAAALELRLSAIPAAFGLIVTGGHTAQRLIAGMPGWHGIQLVGEREPGIVVGRMLASGAAAQLHGRPIVLKAGGFGEFDTLVRCVAGGVTG
ncbi:MAG TPA: four-carbon acid sugar kinase family protein [Chthonomonadaceae bacterium]|nr:four-carbon acid sugar kinase family protein [Chthonomonadaceae bacterium]